jgi:molecular chaperone GrpE (heat shock protein)
MRRSYHRRSADERVADLDKRIAELKAKQSARDKKDDPVLREIQKLLKRLKRFIQHAHDHKRPDVANSVMGFKSMLERILASELGTPAAELAEVEDEDDE